MKKIHILTLLVALAVPATAATVFSFQQGDLRQDGVLLAGGDSYTMVAGSINDNTSTGTLGAGTDAIGNQFRTSAQQTSNPTLGNNGLNFVALFSYDLTALANYVTANPGMTVSQAQFTLIRTGGATGNFIGFNLWKTTPFTTAATWGTSDGTNAWSAPLTGNGTGLAGGGTELTKISASQPSNQQASNTLTWNSSDDFVAAIDDALARGDKTLYAMVKGSFFTNNDGRSTYADGSNATVDNRPELLITLIPEPSTFLLGAIGALSLLRRRR